MRSPWLKTVLLFLTSCTVDANVGADRATTSGDVGSDARAPADATSPSDATSDDGGPTADAPTDASDAVPPMTCGVTIAQEGAWVDLGVVQEVLPQGSGGTIATGTYVLTAIHSYLSGPQGTAQFRETLLVTGSPTVGAFARVSESQNTTGGFSSYAPRGDTSTWTADSPTWAIFITSTCPPANEVYGQYTATSTTLTLLDTMRSIERIYTRAH